MDAGKLMRSDNIDCAVCSTPLQMMNMINLATTNLRDREIDLYILDHAKQNKKYYDALVNAGIFHRVTFLHTKTMTGGTSTRPLLRYLKASVYFMQPGRVRNQLSGIPIYERFYIPTPDVPSQILYYICKKANPAIELYMFEEGTFAYNYFEHEFGYVKKLFLHILYHTDIMKDYKGAYLYHPLLLNNVKNIPLFTLTPMSKGNKVLVDFFNKLSGFDPSSYPKIEKEILFFDQPFLFPMINEKQYAMYDLFAETVATDRLRVKLHPRTTQHPYADVLPFQIPSEIMEMNESFEDKVLVSIFSTASLSPKMLFDEEPTVILLYKLVDLHLMTNINQNTFEIADKIRDTYRQKGKFMIPETLEELLGILASL
jgi:hypothetical protein